MIKWVKPSGDEIETNDNKATVEYCESLKWKRAGEQVLKKSKAKRKY